MSFYRPFNNVMEISLVETGSCFVDEESAIGPAFSE